MRVPVLSAQHWSVLRQTELAAFLEQATMKSEQGSSERIDGNIGGTRHAAFTAYTTKKKLCSGLMVAQCASG